MWLILLLIVIAYYYYFFNNPKPVVTSVTVRCNSESDDACKMYNQRDIQSKCTAMCIKENPKLIFNGKYVKENDDHVCGCEIPTEKFTLDFTNFGDNPDILPDVVPDDSKFSNRNYLEKTEEERYHSLIFG